MKQFLDQFKHLNFPQAFAFDQYIYRLSVGMLGRTAGNWGSIKVGNVWALRLGESDNAKRTPDGRVIVQTPFQSMSTDEVTASVAFTAFVVSGFWNEKAAEMSDEANEEFERVYFGLREGYDSTPGLNVDDYWRLTD